MELKNSDIKWGHFAGVFAVAWVMVIMTMPNPLRGSGNEMAYTAGFVASSAAMAVIPLIIAWFVKRDYAKAAFLAGVLAFTAMSIAGNAGVGRSQMTAEECAIKKMKGQPANMANLVAQECLRKYPRARDL